jgi:hypothetical protein
MPGTFLGFPIVAQTKNFLITSDDNTDANARGVAIAGSCESDLLKLEKLFNTNFQTGDTHEFGVWVHVIAPGPAGGASNYGFERDQSSRIFINGTFNPLHRPHLLSFHRILCHPCPRTHPISGKNMRDFCSLPNWLKF